MVIFHSYVSLPEGRTWTHWRVQVATKNWTQRIESLNPKSSWNINWNQHATCNCVQWSFISFFCGLHISLRVQSCLVLGVRTTVMVVPLFPLVLSFDGIVWLHEQFACLLCRPACDRPLLRNCGARREHVWFVFICSWVFCTWWCSSSLWQYLWGLSNEWKSSPTLDALQEIAKYASPCMARE